MRSPSGHTKTRVSLSEFYGFNIIKFPVVDKVYLFFIPGTFSFDLSVNSVKIHIVKKHIFKIRCK